MKQWLLVGALAAIAVDAHAQQERSARERDILVGLDVGYNTAFREKSWAPVTVEIVNEQRDFDGYIEVRTFDFSNQQQSPSYRMPAQCPKDSRKRFTLYAFLDGAERVEVLLYEGGRRALDVPAYMQVRPIAKDDVLLLVLDDDPFNYGFLYAAVQREGRAVRLSRHGLPTSDLDRLPDIPQAYEAFDAVILGDIQPDRIAQRHRALLANYVAQGGTLVVSVGENAANYRGSWIEPLLGVGIGPTTLTTEGDLARFLPADLRAGLRADRQAEFAALTPGADVRVTGEDGVLAAHRAFGAGQIYTVAIDATSHALQDTPGYQALWRALLTREPSGELTPELNIESFANTLAQALPNLSGVTIRPLGWVMTYLLLYLGVGIVGNWLFWNRLKRREMAWFCLIGFSLAFTVYAMLFGRSGNLREAQQQSAGVLQIEPGTERAKFSVLTGILTARTRTFSGELSGQQIVARDAATHSANTNVFTGMPRGFAQARPFAWVQGEPHRVEGFRVGASELRMLTLEGEKTVPGGIDGTITIDNQGVRGELVNRTGFALESPALMYDGVFMPVRVNGDRFELDVDSAEISRLRANETGDPEQLQYYMYSMGRDREAMWSGVRTALFIDDTYQFQFDMPAYLVGWSDNALDDVGFRPDQAMTGATSRTLVTARIAMDDRRTRANETPLSVELSGGWYRSRGQPPMRYNQPVTQNVQLPLRIRLPYDTVESVEGDLIVELYSAPERDAGQVILTPADDRRVRATPDDFQWHEARLESDGRASNGYLTSRATYHVTDWKQYLENDEPIVTFSVSVWSTNDSIRLNGHYHEYSASARFIPRDSATQATGDWPQWR